MTMPADDTLERETSKLWVTDAENTSAEERGVLEIIEGCAPSDGNKFKRDG